MGRLVARALAMVSLLAVAACGEADPAAPSPTDAERTTAGADGAAEEGAWVRGDEPWRGILTAGAEVGPEGVSVDGWPELPTAAPAYRYRPSTVEDLRTVAELYAGGPVEPGTMPGGSPDLVGFEVADGWFHAYGGLFGPVTYPPLYSSWSWTDRRWREDPPDISLDVMMSCPADTPVPAEAIAFFRRLDLEVEPNGRMDCVEDVVWARFDVLLGGLPVVGTIALAMVDADGRVVDASAPFMTVEPLGELELAPTAEIVRRMAYGPGQVPEDPACGDQPCVYTTGAAELALAAVTTGGTGHHDHTVANAVPGPDEQILVPVLRAPSTTSLAANTGTPHLSAIALSSTLLVDDPAHADLARRADAGAAAEVADVDGERTNGCVGNGNLLFVCSSSLAPSVDQPLVITLGGEVNDPVGAADCMPVLTLDLGDGTTRIAPPPRSGTLVTARTVHTYDEPGTYTVVAHRASRCERPAEPGGSEPEYDDTFSLQVVVSG